LEELCPIRQLIDNLELDVCAFLPARVQEQVVEHLLLYFRQGDIGVVRKRELALCWEPLNEGSQVLGLDSLVEGQARQTNKDERGEHRHDTQRCALCPRQEMVPPPFPACDRAWMTMMRWAVRLAVEDAVSIDLVTALIEVVGNEIWEIQHTGPTADYDDGNDTITFELDATDAQEARIRAQHWLGEVARRRGLPAEQARVIWVSPVLQSPVSSRRFIGMARDLVCDEVTADLAVVAAQIHIELHIKALITNAVKQDSSPLRNVLVNDDGRTWGPQNPTTRALIKALFGVDPAKDYPRWQEYQDHVKRRNDVAHRGQAVSVEDAEASIAVVDDLWLWLGEAAGDP
jgi:hypothetical protein